MSIERLDALFAKYNMPVPDEFVGPEGSKYVLDYGPPVLLADSRREQGGTDHERKLWTELSRLANSR